jgi:hypothetical protein
LAVSVAVTSLVSLAQLGVLPSGSTRPLEILVVAVVVTAGVAVHAAILLGERRRLVPRLASRSGNVQGAEVLE